MPLSLTWSKDWLLVVLVAIGCVLSGRLSEAVLNIGLHASPIWFPAGVGLAALILFGRRLWVGVLLGMIVLALSLGATLPVAMIAALGNTLGAIAGAMLLQQRQFNPSLKTLPDVLNFLGFAVVVSPTVNATISTLNARQSRIVDVVQNWGAIATHWLTIWLGDGIGILVVTPLLLVWSGNLMSERSPRQRQPWFTFSAQTLEFLVWLLLLAVVSWVVFKSPTQTAISHYPLEYLPFPFIAWAALRLGQRGTVLGSLIVSAVAIAGTVQQGGPFLAKTNGNTWHAIFLLQVFVGIITATALVLAAAISERQQVTDLLQKSEARFRVIAETTACGVIVYQGDRLCYANPTAEQISEYSRAELLSMNYWEIAHPDLQEVVRSRGAARQQGEMVPSRYELPIVTKTGKERWVDFTAGLISYEGKPAVLATAYDITDRKQAEAKLILSANRERLLGEITTRIRSSLDLQDILQNTVDEIRSFLNADRVLINCFATAGQRPAIAESVDSRWVFDLDCEVRDEKMREIKALFQQNRVRVINDTSQIEQTSFMAQHYQRCQIKAGVGVALTVNGEFSGVLIANQCSAPREWTQFEIELLEQLANQIEIAIQQGQLYRQIKALATSLEQQVEERTAELQQRMQELQTLNQSKDLLLHAVSHDLRTPVQGMLMLLNRLRGKCGEGEVSVSRFMLDCMIQSSTDQLQLLSSLRDEQTQDGVLPELTCQPVCLNRVLQAALVTLRPIIQQNQVMFVDQMSPDLAKVEGDAVHLRQVFESLLVNAMKHNLPGVTVTVSAELVSSDAPVLHVSVTDNGQGINSEQRDRLFKPYVRSLDNRRCTGIGLGLYRCQQIINAHGGKMGVESQPGAGSTFWFTLPVA